MPTLTILNNNKTIQVDANYPLTQLSHDEVYSWFFDCRGGVCGSCLMEVIEGAENLSPKSDDEQTFLASINALGNQRLACLCRVHGDVTLRFG